MKWEKRGVIFNVEHVSDVFWSHCHKPTPLLIDDHTIRVYFGVRDKTSRTRTTFVDVDSRDLRHLRVKYVHPEPVLNLGKIGAFDDSGANVCSVAQSDGSIYMYFIGWNPSTTVHTRNSIGLAVSNDGVHFERLYDGPVLDRNKDEPYYYTGAVDVLKKTPCGRCGTHPEPIGK